MIGHLRNNYIENFKSFKYFLLNNIKNYTFFIHTWNTISLENKTSTDINIIKNLYKTNNIIIEKQDSKMIHNKNIEHISIAYQLYSLNKIYETYEELKYYDYIIKLRPDIKFRKNIELLYNNEINFYQTNLGGGLDIFFYGNKENMLKTLIFLNNKNLKNINIKILKKPEMIYLKLWDYEKIVYKKNKLKLLKVISILR